MARTSLHRSSNYFLGVASNQALNILRGGQDHPATKEDALTIGLLQYRSQATMHGGGKWQQRLWPILRWL
jgi:hypothetical protein